MSSHPVDTCRDRYGVFNSTFFHLWACSLCYNYIFHGRPLRNTPRAKRVDDIISPLATHVPRHILLYENLSQDIQMEDSPVCRELGSDGCRKLNTCCQAAISCCQNQIKQARRQASPYSVIYRQNNVSGNSPMCPSTWDGFACFEDTPAGNSVKLMCPSYIDHRNKENDVAVKTCTENATWWIDPQTGREWTDYTGCVSLQDFKPLYMVGITCNAISLLCLIPSCAIFLRFKQLRKQHRIRIHLNLFASFILTNCVWICWDLAIFRNRAENSHSSTVMRAYPNICRVLYIVTRYSWACNFFWMSLEGFHLYRLINHAFKTPASINHYYLIGWMAPCIPMCIYSFLRLWKMDTGCWVYHAGFLEWIVYGPNLICIILNVAFLINVLRILLTQIQTHPNEPSNYRRALKATLILVPLFGIQLFLIVYRPYDNITANISYEVIAKIIGNSQGTAISIVFCFFNNEVISVLCNGANRTQTPNSNMEFRSFTYSTNAEHRLEQTRISNEHTTESYPLKSPRNGCYGQDRKVDSPVLSVNWRGGSDSSKIHMI